MSTFHPRTIAQALDDLQGQLTRWSSVASEMLTEANYTQRTTKESVDRATQHAAIVMHMAREDEVNVEKLFLEITRWLNESDVAVSNVHQTLAEVQDTLEEACATLRRWETKLNQAEQWLAEAKKRLEKAFEEYESARSALESAIWDLEMAEARYRDCINDKDRRNCSSEVAAIRRAETEAEQAREWLIEAEQEVNEAQDEVEQAQTRVACCEQAVNFATRSVGLAQETETTVTEATNLAERSYEFAQSADRLVQTAQKEVSAEIAVAEHMMAETRTVTVLTDEAESHLRSADEAGASAKGLVTTAIKELEHRAQLLYEFDMPTLNDG